MNVTTFTFPDADEQALREAVHFYGYATVTHFIRTCGYALIRHHQRQDRLFSPVTFNSAPGVATHPLNLIEQAK
jgi:hypothetical protein